MISSSTARHYISTRLKGYARRTFLNVTSHQSHVGLSLAQADFEHPFPFQNGAAHTQMRSPTQCVVRTPKRLKLADLRSHLTPSLITRHSCPTPFNAAFPMLLSDELQLLTRCGAYFWMAAMAAAWPTGVNCTSTGDDRQGKQRGARRKDGKEPWRLGRRLQPGCVECAEQALFSAACTHSTLTVTATSQCASCRCDDSTMLHPHRSRIRRQT